MADHTSEGLNDDTIVVIPAHNESKVINSTIEKIRMSLGDLDILVVDDGSIDGTSSEASRAGVLVATLPIRLGIGGATQTGFSISKFLKKEFVIQIDADGQHDPDYATAMLDLARAGKADVVVGSRFLSHSSNKMPILRRWGISFFSGLTTIVTGQKFTDTSSGYRLVNSKARDLFLLEYPHDFPDADTLIYLWLNNIRITEIEVPSIPRSQGRSSLRSLRFFFYPVKLMISITSVYLRHRSKRLKR